MEVERRQERSRGGYWGNVGVIGSSFASSAQSKRPETGIFGCFWSKTGCFGCFCAKKLVVAGISWAKIVLSGSTRWETSDL